MKRNQHNIDKFYKLLEKVEEKFPRQSLDKLSSIKLPEKGVYFFFENGEYRNNTTNNRVVRVGTHAAVAKSNATLYDRLYNHKGSIDLTGNHRGSVFRKLIGFSLINSNKLDFKHWGDKSKKGDKKIKEEEKPLEIAVSKYIYSLTFIVLEVPGPSLKDNDRALIEENSIALLSNYFESTIDQHSSDWLGLFSGDKKVISSGLWNNKHVDQKCIDDKYFKTFEYHLKNMNNWC